MTVIRRLLLRLMAMFSFGRPNLVREDKVGAEFWTFLNDREWSPNSGGDLDKALEAFVRLKETYGDAFNVVVEDLHDRHSAGASRGEDRLSHASPAGWTRPHDPAH